LLTESEFTQFITLYNKAERAVQGRKELQDEAAALVECKFTIVGATAIEDRLQDGVPETISELGKAGVKCWVLTGDKM
jgi:P-type E1-E2 ATPase